MEKNVQAVRTNFRRGSIRASSKSENKLNKRKEFFEIYRSEQKIQVIYRVFKTQKEIFNGFWNEKCPKSIRLIP